MQAKLLPMEELSQDTTAKITSDYEQWMKFLQSAGRLYKYPYHEQLMIHAQRPDATACASFDLWNEKMHRRIRRGAKGIALPDYSGGTARMRYVFDVSDTHGGRRALNPYLWEMKPEHMRVVSDTLAREHGITEPSGSLSVQIEEIAKQMASQYWAEHKSEIIDIIDDGFLADYAEHSIGVSFREATAVSAAYAIQSRCGFDPGADYQHEDFREVFDWSAPDTMAALGTAVSQISEQVLRQIEVVVKTQERQQASERSGQHEQHNVFPERGLPDPRPDAGRAGRHAAGQVRQNAQAVPDGQQAHILQFPGVKGNAVQAPIGDTRRREPAPDTDDPGDGESRGHHRADEGRESNGLGGRDEQYPEPRGGNDPAGADLQVDLFPTENQQKHQIEEAERNAAPAASSFSTEDVDAILRSGTGMAGGKLRVYAMYHQEKDAKDIQAFLKKEYGTMGRGHTFLDGSRGWVDYGPGQGMKLSRSGNGEEMTLSWSAMEKHLRALVAADTYLTDTEKQQYAQMDDDMLDVINNGLLNDESKSDLLTRLGMGASDADISRFLSETYGVDTMTMELETGDVADYYTNPLGLQIAILDKFGTEKSMSWFEVARAVRVLSENWEKVHEPAEIAATEPEEDFLDIDFDAVRERLQNRTPEDTARLDEMLAFARAAAKQWDEPEPAVDAEHIPADVPKAQNFHITDMNLGAGGAKTKYAANVAAIRTLQTIEGEHRAATPEEQEILSRYVGWGGIPQAFDQDKADWASEYAELKELLSESEYASARASTMNAHYTSPTVIQAIYGAVEKMGFTNGNVLEPACGTGNFFGLLPQSMEHARLYGVELDSITGRIAGQLYPDADITVSGFEQTDRRDFFDLAIGNVPFGNYKVSDKAYDKHNFLIHDYFFAKTLDQVRPGGVIAFITSKGTLDKQNPEVRRYLAQRAELLGAVRLPNNAFKANAGTEVTSDIIFLQKREQPMTIEPDWVHLGLTEEGIPVNSYFAEHPEMVLGTMAWDDRMYGSGKETTCHPLEGADLAAQMELALSNVTGRIPEAELPDLGDGELLDTSMPADPDVRNYSYTVVDGEVYYRENSRMVRPEIGQTARERIKGLVQLRDCVHTLIDQQLRPDTTNDTIRETQAEMNLLYDAFTAKHGLINSRGNAQAFSADSAYYLLCSLEILDEQRQLARKADMFSKRTIMRRQSVTSVDTASEALAVSIGERARVDLDFMEALSGLSREKLLDDLRGVVFLNVGGAESQEKAYVTADEYLSGNIREKLRLAQAAAELNPALSVNVEALQAAMPKDLDASEISVRLGATWLDKSYIQQFMQELLEPPSNLRDDIQVEYSEHTAEWHISEKSSVPYNNVAAYATYGTQYANAYRILEDTLNLRDVRIFDTVQDADGKEKRVLNSKATTLAQQKQQAIKDAFRDWIWNDPERRQTLVRQYNEQFNSTRPRQYDGSHINFSGMNPEITLRPHQCDAIAHILYGGNTLLAHEVGAGKTFEMVAAAMEERRLGLCQKPLFAVPNHLTEQWGAEFLRLYPSANILVTTKKDFETKNRKKFCARIATGDYDAIIMGHSQFERVPMSAERQERTLREQISEIEEGLRELKSNRGERFTVKQMERTRKGLETKLKNLLNSGRKDDVVTFEQLGVDRLYVDEAHGYKNDFIYTKMRNVAGLSTSEAQKSADMRMKCRYLDEITGGKGVVFATGTPISNSMSEMFVMMRYLQNDTLTRKGLTHFDAWASTFGETVTAIELAPEGTGYRARTRFSKFYNLPELMTLFREVADIKTADQLNLPTPEAVYHNVLAKPTDIQKDMVQELSERASVVHKGGIDPAKDNMLKISSDGRKLGLDQRIINPLLPDDPDSKVNQCVRNIEQIWRDGQADKLTQLVFCDISTPKGDGSFNVYEDIRRKLVSQGIPKNQIAFIHDANTEVRKKELFAKVRSGQVRVLMGSTAKMGAGMNVQDRLVALHDLDCPWRPGDLEQRSGRIIRQGNQNKQVHIYRYATEQTFDSYLWQTVENKQKFISQIMTSKSPVRSCQDIDETALSYAEIKALCAGNPEIREKMDLDIDVARLNLLKGDHLKQQHQMQDQLRTYYPAQIELYKRFVAGFESDARTAAANAPPKSEFHGMELHGKQYADKDAAGAALLEARTAVAGAKAYETVRIGCYRGFAMAMSLENFGKDYTVTLKGNMSHKIELGDDVFGNITRLDNALASITKREQDARGELDNLTQQMESVKREIGKPFQQEAELAQKSARLAELDASLSMDAGRSDGAEAAPPEKKEVPPEERPSVLAALNAPGRSGPASKKTQREKDDISL